MCTSYVMSLWPAFTVLFIDAYDAEARNGMIERCIKRMERIACMMLKMLNQDTNAGIGYLAKVELWDVELRVPRQ